MKQTILRRVCTGDVHTEAPIAAFEVASYPIPTEPDIFEKRRQIDGITRPSVRFTVRADAQVLAATFANGSPWYIEETTVIEDENGQSTSETKRYDKSSFCIAGDVVAHRNGTVTVYMAEMTEGEKQIASLEEENARLLYENLTGEALA